MDDLFALDPTKIAKWVEALNADHSQDKIALLNEQLQSVMVQLNCAHAILDQAGIKRSVMRAHFTEEREYHLPVEQRLFLLTKQIERLLANGPRSGPSWTL